MRVELPKAAANASPDADPTPSSGAPPPPKRREQQASAWELLAIRITSRRIAWPMVTVAVLLFTWSLIIRRPVGEHYLKVSARAKALALSPVQATNNISVDDVQKLQLAVSNLSKVMITQRKGILPLLAALESSARTNGWRCERSLKPPQPFGHGLTNLELHPVVLRLQPMMEVRPGLYSTLMQWLNSIPELEKRGEVASLQIQAGASGIQSAEVKIHFFSLESHEETAPK